MSDDIIKGIPINSKGFGTISKLAMQDRNLHINAKAIYAYFNSFAGGGDQCFPTRKRICYDLGISNDTFSKYLKQLTENGYITVEQVKDGGRFSHNVYTLCSTISPCPKISDTENVGNGKLDTNKNNTNINNNSNINNSKERKKAASGYDEIITEYTSNEELKQALYDFIKMRKLIKKPLTDRALKLQLSQLDKVARTGTDTEKVEILNQSIMNNWQGVYELKNRQSTSGNNRPTPARQETDAERANRELNEQIMAMVEGRTQ